MKKSAKSSKSIRSLYIILAAVWVLIIALNLLAWFCTGFSDFCAGFLNTISLNTYCRLTGLLSFSAGEVMLTAAVIILFCMVILSAVLLVRVIAGKLKPFPGSGHSRSSDSGHSRSSDSGHSAFSGSKHSRSSGSKPPRFFRFMRLYYRTVIIIATVICFLMTVNCTVYYHTSSIDPNPEKEARTYTVEDLKTLRNFIIEKCNEYSLLVDRAADGSALYTGNMQETAKAALQNLAARYPRLAGYYPDVKTMMYSDLMCQMSMSGYFFPFSMEANCNGNMYIMNYPEVYCHELAHLHGYIYEDEANFISFVACTESGDDFFTYSGYLAVLNYVYNAYYAYVTDWDDYAALPATTDLVNSDNIFLTETAAQEVEENSVLDTETVSEISEDFTDSMLKANGVEDGMISYSRVVGLLLEYYDGVLY